MLLGKACAPCRVRRIEMIVATYHTLTRLYRHSSRMCCVSDCSSVVASMPMRYIQKIACLILSLIPHAPDLFVRVQDAIGSFLAGCTHNFLSHFYPTLARRLVFRSRSHSDTSTQRVFYGTRCSIGPPIVRSASHLYLCIVWSWPIIPHMHVSDIRAMTEAGAGK